jgi:hypothetical protein
LQRSILVAAALVAILVPLVPPAAASSCTGTETRVGDPQTGDHYQLDPVEPHTFADCCSVPTLAFPSAGDTYYLNVRAVAAAQIYHDPHPNGRIVEGVQEILAGRGPGVLIDTFVKGLAGPTYPPTELVSPGAAGVATSTDATGVWIYQESNGQPGLQRGGTQAGIEDPCVDPLAAGVMWHDTLVL